MGLIFYHNMVEKLLKAIPELRPLYEAELAFWSERGSKHGLDFQHGLNPHTAYDRVLVPYLIAALKAGDNDEVMSRVFAFLEEVATEVDEQVRSVAKMTVCYQLTRDPDVWRTAQRFMGPVMLRASEEIEAYASLNERLVRELTELRPAYEAELAWWGDEKPGPTIVYEHVLLPYLIERLSADGGEKDVQRVFGFLEGLAKQNDKHVNNVLGVAICEALDPHQEWSARACKSMGRAMRQVCEWHCAPIEQRVGSAGARR